MDEIDAIGGKRFSEGTSADREIQRTLMELLSQLDGFDVIGKVRIYRCGDLCTCAAHIAEHCRGPALTAEWLGCHWQGLKLPWYCGLLCCSRYACAVAPV